MAGSSIGEIFRITTFGESHGKAIGVVIDGCPAGLHINEEFIQNELDRRKPGQSSITTQRKEGDRFEILSGVFEGKTLGSPITLLIHNEDQKSGDYAHLKEAYRPSHADYTYEMKYGLRDHRGGGRASARETAARVMAGAIAKQLLQTEAQIQVVAYVSQVGSIRLEKNYTELDLSKTDSNIVRCPDEATANRMIDLIQETRKKGDTVGGIITGVIRNCPVGLGEPVFDKLHADLGKAMLSIHAVHGFEYGSGFEGAVKFGSQNNDAFTTTGDKITTKTNYSGGIQGGISNGMDIYFRVAFKPVATIMQTQQSVDNEGNEIQLAGKGRHDPCVLPRAVPIVEAMTSLVIADHLLRSKLSKIA